MVGDSRIKAWLVAALLSCLLRQAEAFRAEAAGSRLADKRVDMGQELNGACDGCGKVPEVVGLSGVEWPSLPLSRQAPAPRLEERGLLLVQPAGNLR
jgi:hypothetical protein